MVDDRRREPGAGGIAAVWLKGAAAAAGLAAAMAVLVTCERQDPLAPEGSTIKVTANPQTIAVQSSIPGTAEITATLRAKNGTRIPDQEVTFSTTEGVLDPVAETPLITDDQGQATCKLTTAKQATVTAQSGSISGSTTVSVVTGDLFGINLDPDPNSPTSLTFCDETVTLIATAVDAQGAPIPGVLIRFLARPVAGVTELRGSFSVSQRTTDVNGEVTTVYNVDDNSCNNRCSETVGDPNRAPWECAVDIVAQDSSGSFESNVVSIDEDVP